MSDEELRRDVAMCTRLLVQAGILEYSGHVSARTPDGAGLVVIQRVDDVRATLVPERLLVVDLDGQLVEGDGKPPSEVFIHTEIYRARPDVRAIAHFHHDVTTMFSFVKGVELVPVKNHASRWASGVPVHPDASHIDSAEKGAAVAHTLGTHHATLLRSHGEVVVAEGIHALFADALHLVENAECLARALALGPVEPLGADEVAEFLATFHRDKHASKVWSYFMAIAAHDEVIPDAWC